MALKRGEHQEVPSSNLDAAMNSPDGLGQGPSLHEDHNTDLPYKVVVVMEAQEAV